jgi:hypothetical protein
VGGFLGLGSMRIARDSVIVADAGVLRYRNAVLYVHTWELVPLLVTV